jgi:hypothetical protein
MIPCSSDTTQQRPLASESEAVDWWRRRESNPRPQALRCKIYVRSRVFVLVVRYPTGREDVRPAQERFNVSALSTPRTRACERVP